MEGTHHYEDRPALVRSRPDRGELLAEARDTGAAVARALADDAPTFAINRARKGASMALDATEAEPLQTESCGS